VKFIGGLEKKMILASGGEPLLWDRFEDLIKRTDHYWYFVTNTSRIPEWLNDSEIKKKVKLFLSAFHRDGITVENYIANVKKIQDMGYAIFSKIMYTRHPQNFNEAEKIINNRIPLSFVPLVGEKYNGFDKKVLRTYCMSEMYYNRFSLEERKPAVCIAGTKDSFQVDGMVITRCGHYSSISLNNMPKIARLAYNGYVCDVNKPKYMDEPVICKKKECFCENFNFGGILDTSENPRWQEFIDTGVWK